VNAPRPLEKWERDMVALAEEYLPKLRAAAAPDPVRRATRERIGVHEAYQKKTGKGWPV
jgi:hypothetical protein